MTITKENKRRHENTITHEQRPKWRRIQLACQDTDQAVALLVLNIFTSYGSRGLQKMSNEIQSLAQDDSNFLTTCNPSNTASLEISPNCTPVSLVPFTLTLNVGFNTAVCCRGSGRKLPGRRGGQGYMTRCLDRWGRKGRWKKFSRRNLGSSRRKKNPF